MIILFDSNTKKVTMYMHIVIFIILNFKLFNNKAIGCERL